MFQTIFKYNFRKCVISIKKEINPNLQIQSIVLFWCDAIGWRLKTKSVQIYDHIPPEI